MKLIIPLLLAMTVTATHAEQTAQIETQTIHKKIKPPFSQRHPRVFGAVHKLRQVCEEVQPIIGVAGSIGQVLYVFHI